jgi:hypothetical protein
MSAKALWRYLTASSGFANCANAGLTMLRLIAEISVPSAIQE